MVSLREYRFESRFGARSRNLEAWGDSQFHQRKSRAGYSGQTGTHAGCTASIKKPISLFNFSKLFATHANLPFKLGFIGYCSGW